MSSVHISFTVGEVLRKLRYMKTQYLHTYAKKHLPLPNLTDNWSEEHKKLANCFNVTKRNIANATPCPYGNGLR